MEPMSVARIPEAVQVRRTSVRVKTRTHSRLIDDVLNEAGNRTGKVFCLECLAVIDDPYLGMK